MNKNLFKPISYAFVAQILSLLVSMFMTFFVSKYISISNYGYYQLFLFYSTYMPLLQFGLSEGVYLENGGRSYSSLDYDDLHLIFYNGLSCIFIVGFLLYLCSSIILTDITIVLLELLFAIVNYIYTFFGLLLQASKRTTDFSFSVIVGKILTLLLFISFVFFKMESYIWYCGSFIIGHLLTSIIVTIKCKEIAIRKIGFKFVLFSKRKTVFSGLSLLVSGLASSFLLGINRIFIELYYGIDYFAKVSMALNLINIFIVFAIQFGMVLFPELAKLDINEQKTAYVRLCRYTTFLFPVLFLLYLPIKRFLPLWIPKYKDSINWMLLFIPYMVYEIKTQIVYNTFIKILRDEKKLLLVNLASLFASAITGYYILNNANIIEVLFIAINVIMISKSFFMSQIIEKKLSLKNGLGFICEAILVLGLVLVFYFWLVI